MKERKVSIGKWESAVLTRNRWARSIWRATLCRHFIVAALILSFLASVQESRASVTVFGRESHLRADFFFGYANEWFRGGDKRDNIFLTGFDDIENLNGETGADGDYRYYHWAGMASWDLQNYYRCIGAGMFQDGSYFYRVGEILLAASTKTHTDRNASATSSDLSVSNDLSMRFMVTANQSVHITGDLYGDGPYNRNRCEFRLLHWENETWKVIYISSSVAVSKFWTDTHLEPGHYEARLTVLSHCSGNEDRALRSGVSIKFDD